MSQAAFLLDFSFQNLQAKYLNISVLSEINLGRILILRYLSLCKA